MDIMTITKTEYRSLKQRAEAYERLGRLIELEFFAPPPSKHVKYVISEFRRTKKYPAAFLKSLEKGLRRSSYFKV